MKKIIILILSTNNNDYKLFIDALKDTWVKKARTKNIECFFYEGGYNKNYIDGGTIKLNVNDNLKSTSEKLIEAIKVLQDNNVEFDFIFRTNLSSFIFIDNFLDYFIENENNIIYSGHKGKCILSPRFLNRFGFLHNLYFRYLKPFFIQDHTILSSSGNIHKNNLFSRFSYKFNFLHDLYFKYIKIQVLEFASGSGFWLSKEAVQILLSEKKKDLKLIDDVMVGKVMADNKIKVTNCDRVILQDDKFISNDIDFNRIKANYHVRLKSFKNRDIDVKRMYKLDKIEISNNIESDLLEVLNC